MGIETETEAERIARLTRSFNRGRWVLLALAIALPLGLRLIFEHAAARPELSPEQVAANRSIALKIELGVAAFFLFNLVLNEVKRRKLLQGEQWIITPRAMGRVLCVLIIGCAVVADLSPEVGVVFGKAFGPTPFGIPVVPLITTLNVLLMVPYFWVFDHLMQILSQAIKDGAFLSRGGIAVYLWQAARLHPELARSRRIVLGGLAYFVLLMTAWIAYAASRGI